MSKKRFLNVREGFYRELFVLVIPIVIQNLITSAVSMADVVMLGRYDQTALSASSLAGQVQFILNIVFFGLASAVTILASQYWGKRDSKTVSKILGMGLIISVTICTVAAILALFSPYALISIWTDIPELRAEGAKYLKFVALSYLFAGFSQPYLSIMKSCERVLLSTAISFTTLWANVLLNACLIFGLGPFPELGIVGAALATTIVRGIELLICIIDFTHQKIISRSFVDIFKIPRFLISDFVKYCLPAFINDALWGFAFNMNSIIMGHLEEEIVAANSIVTVARDLVSVTGFGISAASSIMLGKEIGEGKPAEARKDASSILKVAFLASLLQGLILLIMTPFIPGFVVLTEKAADYLTIMLLISTVYQMGQVINTVLIASLFRCGGDSKYGMFLDIICMWCFAVPLGFISAFVLKLPSIVVYMLMCTDEFAKMPFAFRHYKKGNWIKDLTRT